MSEINMKKMSKIERNIFVYFIFMLSIKLTMKQKRNQKKNWNRIDIEHQSLVTITIDNSIVASSRRCWACLFQVNPLFKTHAILLSMEHTWNYK